MSWTCPRCCEQELEPWAQDPQWLTCPDCGGMHQEDDLAEYYDQLERSEAYRDLRAVWQEETRRRAPGGGGDDGLATLPDIRDNEADHCIVQSSTATVGARGNVVRVRGLDCSSGEARVALLELLDREKG